LAKAGRQAALPGESHDDLLGRTKSVLLGMQKAEQACALASMVNNSARTSF
jgi:hypothetical protein